MSDFSMNAPTEQPKVFTAQELLQINSVATLLSGNWFVDHAGCKRPEAEPMIWMHPGSANGASFSLGFMKQYGHVMITARHHDVCEQGFQYPTRSSTLSTALVTVATAMKMLTDGETGCRADL